MVVPEFNHNLLYIHKLASDNKCAVKFTLEVCEIVNSQSNLVVVGRVYNGLYYLFDEEVNGSTSVSLHGHYNAATVDANLWHLRFGHASLSKMKNIPHLKSHLKTAGQVYVMCPISNL